MGWFINYVMLLFFHTLKVTGFAEDFSTPPKPRQKAVKKPKYRRAKGVKSGTKTPRKKDTIRAPRKRKSTVADLLSMTGTPSG